MSSRLTWKALSSVSVRQVDVSLPSTFLSSPHRRLSSSPSSFFSIVTKSRHWTRSNMPTSAAATAVVPTPKLYSAVANSAIMKDINQLEETLDPIQKQLLNEECITVDENDRVIGHDSKKNCHLVRNGDVKLHRAFSVFVFNSKGELLMQQRSKSKITFPLMWTNSCCSHPLNATDEMEEDCAMGIRTAARRRMAFELGISTRDISLNDFHYLTRIHYKALSNPVWGEHEIDYILFLQKDLKLSPNPNEIQEIRYVSMEELQRLKIADGVVFTPWFQLIVESRLPQWWNNLNNLKPFEDHVKIHRML